MAFVFQLQYDPEVVKQVRAFYEPELFTNKLRVVVFSRAA